MTMRTPYQKIDNPHAEETGGPEQIIINKALARRVDEHVCPGLVGGTPGEPEKGKMCVQSAVACAMGWEHGDKPPCIGPEVREDGIDLNDAQQWDDEEARAAGLRRFAISELGSNTIDQMQYKKVRNRRIAHRLLAPKLRTLAEQIKLGQTADDFEDWNIAEHDLRAEKTQANRAKAVTLTETLAKVIQDKDDWNDLKRVIGKAMVDMALPLSVCELVEQFSDFSLSGLCESDAISGQDDLLQVVACVCDALKELKSPGTRWLDVIEERG